MCDRILEDNDYIGQMSNMRTHQTLEQSMGISYKKLWHLLLDRNMTKTDLQKSAQLSWGTLSRMNHGENIGTDTLLRICQVLKCELSDIMEIDHAER